jgi:hypothetical protein
MDHYHDDSDMIPLGEALEDRAWREALALAKLDISKAMGVSGSDTSPVEFIDAEAMLAIDYGPTPWLVDGICTEQAVMVIGGEPKTAKTWAAIELAIAVATDTPAFGEFKVRNEAKRGAFLFLCEDGPRSVQRRLRSMITGRGPVLSGWGTRLKVKALGSMHIDDADALARYVATVRASGVVPALVVFDPLRDLHANNEDSSTEMVGVYKSLRALRTVLGCAVVFVHHSGKVTADSDKRRGGQRLRGSSALHGAVDAGLYLTSPSKERDESKRKTTMRANVEGEVKAAAGVGDFSLALDVFDDANREAVRAQWAYSREGAEETTGKGKGDPLAASKAKWTARVIDCLKRHDAKKPTVPVSLRQIKADLGVGGGRSNQLTEIIGELVFAGQVEATPGLQGHPAYRLLAVPGGTVVGRIGTAPQEPEDHWPDDPAPDEDDWLT